MFLNLFIWSIRRGRMQLRNSKTICIMLSERTLVIAIVSQWNLVSLWSTFWKLWDLFYIQLKIHQLLLIQAQDFNCLFVNFTVKWLFRNRLKWLHSLKLKVVSKFIEVTIPYQSVLFSQLPLKWFMLNRCCFVFQSLLHIVIRVNVVDFCLNCFFFHYIFMSMCEFSFLSFRPSR